MRILCIIIGFIVLYFCISAIQQPDHMHDILQKMEWSDHSKQGVQ